MRCVVARSLNYLARNFNCSPLSTVDLFVLSRLVAVGAMESLELKSLELESLELTLAP